MSKSENASAEGTKLDDDWDETGPAMRRFFYTTSPFAATSARSSVALGVQVGTL